MSDLSAELKQSPQAQTASPVAMTSEYLCGNTGKEPTLKNPLKDNTYTKDEERLLEEYITSMKMKMAAVTG
jgi:hypothetical protein